ncbi:cytochrome P450 [Streptomyces sp. NPDC091377]|uniref:cytochrome P450 n=1 Tax=Streptomyces sp. NPDC091377 TaxID=3365995 RepID=UPI003814DC69
MSPASAPSPASAGPHTLLRRISDDANRADPYPLYAELREAGVVRQEDGSYLVGTYDEVAALLHDPRISSDPRSRDDYAPPPGDESGRRFSFIARDDPEHDRLRALAMRPFGPPHSPGRVDALHGDITRIARELTAAFAGRDRVDLVDDFAYPLPVTVISTLLGVPHEDVPRIHAWTDTIITALDRTRSGGGAGSPDADNTDDTEKAEKTENAEKAEARRLAAAREMGDYLGALAESRRGHPGDDMLSAFVNDEGPDGRLTPPELRATAVLLLIAGHETTVNLITNGMLTLLRRPDALTRLREEPGLMPSAVEELLRYEPPVQLLPQRTPLADIEVAGVTVPRGAPLILAVASANRDPRRFPDPDRFVPDRPDNRHLGFGGGPHNCYGAPLARLETQIALTELLRALDTPTLTLVTDPPPYRRSPVLRGPRHLLVDL